jgi:glycosyltransferase involved in cell wall biosynthesis
MKLMMVMVDAQAMLQFRGPLIRHLVAQGHQVLAVAPIGRDIVADDVSARFADLGAIFIEAPLQRTGLNPFADLALTVWLYRLINRHKPDGVLCYQAKAVIFGLLAALLARIPLRVATIEGLGIGFMRGGGSLKQHIVQFMVPLLYRLVLWSAHLVFFLNPDDEAEFRQRRLITGRQRVVRIPGIGVDLQYYAQAPLPPGPPIEILTIARLTREKGIRDLFAAAKIVRAKRSDIHFTVLGPLESGPSAIALSEVQSWQQEGVLRYMGAVADIRPFMHKSHIFLLPSWREGLPRSTMEALAMGRPVITTDAPGARETVQDNVNGVLVPPQNPQLLAEAILRMASQPEQWQKMAEASHEMAVCRYDVNHVNQLITTELATLGKSRS